MTRQTRADGTLRHLLTLEGLSRGEIERLLDRAQQYVRPLGARPATSEELAGITVANLFTEPSTRTRVSFELAAKRLGAEVVNLEVQLSSRAKGESMLDTIFTLESLHVDAFVIRDAEAGVPGLVAASVAPHVSVLSAGEGSVSHPTQGLLDALTIRQRKGHVDGLTIAIVGDVRHSRVARSAHQALTTLGAAEVRIVAPPALLPGDDEFRGCSRHTDIEAGLRDADVVMALRIQRERMQDEAQLDAAAYFSEFGLTSARLRLARPNAIVMHPQPMNRGVEIASDVADGPKSAIRDQVRNGVAVRMAVLATVVRPA
ncbi:MAG: aspartate carbamoyltransferase catalytic subunit [Steroidobacteraceae bacterium]|nr:aspartate carbamoyltransferase catalytic subunit [Steroidobacteraceae bacterium]